MTFSAVLLAGGESRRMGRDKATMEFEGVPLWRRQLQLLRALEPQKLFVSARTRPEWLPADTELLLDDPPSRGPLSGLTKALAVMRTTHLIALAVDMPFMTVSELRKLRELATENSGVVPVIGERAEPLAAIYPAHAAADFKAALAGDDFSLQRLVGKFALRHKIATKEAVDLYRNFNTPEFDA
jgi:molybdopterin-guanine dinucleotide biosynthesis protein A